MSGLCGWLGSAGGGARGEELIRRMGARLNRFDRGELEVESGHAFGLAAAQRHSARSLARSEGLVAAVVGPHHWTDPELESISF